MLLIPGIVLRNVKFVWPEPEGQNKKKKTLEYVVGVLNIKKPNRNNFIIFRSLTHDFDCQRWYISSKY